MSKSPKSIPGNLAGVQHNYRTRRVKILMWQKSHDILVRLAGNNGKEDPRVA